ncbi:MAG: DUF882 domain-containing protein [Clostridia bacterium]|nr:DUF882 domain-containing protein [Clostridia bacterium]
MVKTYSVKKDGNTKLSANFMVKEFACKDGSDKILIDTDLVTILQKIRDHFGKPITINSAYRNAAHNAKVGGVSNSPHIKGIAADICISGVAPADVAKYAEYIMPNKGGIGLYLNFVHVDVRTSRSRWTNYGSEKVVSGFPGYTPPVQKLETANDIVWQLNQRGIITDSALWLKKLTPNSNAYWLAYKAANMTVNTDKHKNLNTVNDIVWELNKRGIMTDSKLWMQLLANDMDLYWLALKICNQTKNK